MELLYGFIPVYGRIDIRAIAQTVGEEGKSLRMPRAPIFLP